MKSSIFISYCHEDVKPDSGRLAALLREFEEVAAGTVEILVDSRHPASSVGQTIQQFVEMIRQVDAVMLLLTPGYKAGAEGRLGTGVSREYREIVERLKSTSAVGRYGREFLLIPILWSGEREEVCPTDLRDLVWRDLRWLQVAGRTRTTQLRRSVRADLIAILREIRGRVEAISVTRTSSFREREEGLFRQFLFDDSKSRWNDPANHRYLKSAFVKTSAYLQARNKQVSFLIGRKGSGKSTIVHVLPLTAAEEPEIHLQLEFDKLPLSAAFNVLRSRPGASSDLRQVFSPVFSYQVVWDIFLHLCVAWHLRDQLPARSPLRSFLRKSVEPKVAIAGDSSEATAIVTATLFASALERVMGYVEGIARRPRVDGESLAGIVGDFHPSAVRLSALPTGAWDQLQMLLRAVADRAGRILVTADGFDVVSGYLRESTADGEEKQFERELLLALFQIVLNPGPGRMGGGALYRVVDFCVAMPFDRFAEARAIDRDRYQYRQRVAMIGWSGVELSALVRKRLALLRNIRDPKGPDLKTRLDQVMAKGFRELPAEISFQLGAANYRIPLFLYILRHTLWRPRDVLHYYARLLAASELAVRQKMNIDSAFVRQVVGMATRHVVDDEVLKEFSGYFSNLRDVLLAFRKAPQFVGWDEIESRIGGVVFDVDLAPDERATLEWRVETLFELGILGVCIQKNLADQWGVGEHSFVFSEGHVLKERVGRESYSETTFILHPVLCEYLNLDTTGNPGLALQYKWEYLEANEIRHAVKLV